MRQQLVWNQGSGGTGNIHQSGHSVLFLPAIERIWNTIRVQQKNIAPVELHGFHGEPLAGEHTEWKSCRRDGFNPVAMANQGGWMAGIANSDFATFRGVSANHCCVLPRQHSFTK
jgi:hypothetical protein